MEVKARKVAAVTELDMYLDAYFSVVTLKSWCVVCNVNEALIRLLLPSFLVLLFESGLVSSCPRNKKNITR